jgi:hypothetical protein
MDVRLNKLEIMCRSLLLTPRNDDYFSSIVPDMKMIEELKSRGESYLKVLIANRCRYKLLENCHLGYTHKGIDEKNCVRWLKWSRNTIRLLVVSDEFLPVTRHGPVSWSNKGFIKIHIIAITGEGNEFVEIDMELNLDDDHQDLFIRIVSTLTNFDKCCMNYFNTFVGNKKLCSSGMPQ